jgi:hypothetical protein
LLIPVTSFFRDTDAFEILSRQVIEPLVMKKQAGESIRVWLAAVSTGEEAYSVAMLFLEAFDQLKHWPSLKIFATDVEQQNMETAVPAPTPSPSPPRFHHSNWNDFSSSEATLLWSKTSCVSASCLPATTC